jgi:hypothetical protein
MVLARGSFSGWAGPAEGPGFSVGSTVNVPWQAAATAKTGEGGRYRGRVSY